MAGPPDALLAFASAFPIALLGALLLLARPRRPPQLFFGAFALLWGCQLVLANLGRVLNDDEVHEFSLLLSFAFYLPAFVFLVHFAVLMRPRPWRWVPTAAAGALALGGLAVLVVDPALVVERVVMVDGRITTTYGDGAVYLFQIPFFASFYVAIALLYVEYRRAAPGTARHRVRGVFLALVLFASFIAVRQVAAAGLAEGGFATFSSSSVRVGSAAGTAALTALFALGLLFLAGLATHLYVRPPPLEGRDAPLLAAFAIPAATALVERLVLETTGLPFDTLGFWRFVSVGVLVFTLSRYQLFDLELKAKRAVGPVLAGLLALFGIPVAMTLATGGASPLALGITVLGEAIGVGGILVFQNRLREALLPGVSESRDYVEQRKLELYRVALEDAFARGASPDDPRLRELRVRLGVSDRDHTLLAWMEKPAGGAEGPSQVEVGDLVLERYRVRRLLGQGTHGRTFLAFDRETRQEVALKAVSTRALGGEAAKLLLREARLAASLDHPNVIRILDVAEGQSMVVVVMEYADHGNFETYLAQRGKLPLPEATAFLDQLLAALDAVHARRIVHRNLKPKNILIEEDGSVRLADFGAAVGGASSSRGDRADNGRRARAGAGSRRRASAPGRIAASKALLSPLYQSPEQLHGEPATERSDLFVAAVLFHQALSGRYYLPIAATGDVQIRSLILAGMKPDSLGVGAQPPGVVSFLDRALALDPAQRFRSAAAMRQALSKVAALTEPAGRRVPLVGRRRTRAPA